MFFEVFNTVSTTLQVVFIGTWAGALVLQARAVRGTRVRHRATTFRVGSAASVTILAGIGSVVSTAEGDQVTAIIRLIAIIVWGWETKRSFDDDNWFNDQWKRVKRGFKKLKQKLASLTPTPLPSPA